MRTSFVIILLLFSVLSQTSTKSRQKRQGFIFPSEGESCRTPRNQPGVCIPLNGCQQLRRSRDFALLRNSICGYDRDMPRVCCSSASPPVVTQPPITEAPTTVGSAIDQETPIDRIVPVIVNVTIRPPVTPPRQKPAILPEECGHSTVALPRIVGGAPADLAAWPWMVIQFITFYSNRTLAAVYVTRNGLGRGTDCGGALATARHVITAAHCVTDRRGNQMSASTFTVRVGEHILNDDNDGASPVDVPVTRIVRHENFQRRVFKNDIAILTLQSSVHFNRFVRPICLPYDDFSNDDLAGRGGYVAGWGTTAFDGEYSPRLSQIQVPIWRNEDCNRVYRAERVPITQEYLCAGVSDGTKDSCQGDSGGPLMLPSANQKFYLVGIVSFGKRCATIGYPGVYTRLNLYLDWITTNLT